MNLEKYKDNRKWEDLTEEEQNEWNNLAANLKTFQILFYQLCQKKNCIYCNTKFPEGIINKKPKEDRPLNAYDWFKPDFLVHTQTTHGLSPEDLQHYLEKISQLK